MKFAIFAIFVALPALSLPRASAACAGGQAAPQGAFAELLARQLARQPLSTEVERAPRTAQGGCCSWHSGVCGCNPISGHATCCDGTTSHSCGC
jgi:hypothetical protein